ncbi:venom serine protease-like [Pectinophora gossypiella]|uniref:venom serine protease-like n=1 Tax=Pectinophora gossypiella TaxID=13191 RepID=UPI00214EB2D0|nr:venom serine protease-like [Pectinophora gossypiella]XP_049880103.1 venom serine protease-like [Pectinophora gossypiella]XP_049880104.1 venom serine protease-like [Pectinophora gossypiella]XP_049880105.1 venom serine protease-like [Pectinophora gossypiella]XP_049880107.1 venom serine protease-like [Pectinophora gossypiella]XP_049880108.1 venom serine protease-like [Pectinophora gossypiella]XP_049880109.1 venom serine protease-like [Pectinophora gossypiella]
MLGTAGIVLALFGFAAAQDSSCDYSQQVQIGQTYYVYSPNYPNYYPRSKQCRWVGYCPRGYNCRLDCSEIRLPFTTNCAQDRLLISKSGDLQLNNADRYCGTGSVTAVSTGQVISIGLIVANNSPGGRFTCQLSAQPATPTDICRCGWKKSNRIVGGVPTGVNEYPMMVGLVDLSIRQIKCGGVIINPRSVLTAAHCLAYQSTSNIAIAAGEHDTSTGNDTSALRVYPVANFIIHPQFNSQNYDYDIGIVNSAQEIVFSDAVGPVCLPFKYVNNDFAGTYLTALGWGTLFIGGPTSNVLRKVDIQVQSQPKCRSMISITDRQMCTLTQGKDACQDDSGGPLLFTDPSTGLQFSIGIISSGQFCDTGSPGINTRVTQLLNWITTQSPYNYCVK